ncbi:SIMPL domain-containing protein [Pseudoduganella violaceinigra]|uniref:SIMPL domain-containing protein n=1 Tax=Pseudoduganella violaceinigra TaxID=246602 RepID=UPI000421079C|nr:SIMPL domain-containing protein [Pseudoduganella violaceinigra]
MTFSTTIAALAFCALPAICAAQASGTALPPHPFVSTSGKAQLWMRPDIGEVKFEAGAQDASPEAAAGQLQQLSAGVAQLLAEHGVQEADIECYELEKKMVAVDEGKPPVYSIGRLYHARVRDLAQWPDLVAKLLEMAHVTSISSSFDRIDGDDINTQLMAAAADDARTKGNALAKAFGRKLGPVVAVARGPLTQVGAPFMEAQAGRETRGTPPEVGRYKVPDSIPYSQTVNAIFVLK